MASPGNQHCANCIGALSFPVIGYMEECRYRCSDVAAASVHDTTATRRVQANVPAVLYCCAVS